MTINSFNRLTRIPGMIFRATPSLKSEISRMASSDERSLAYFKVP